MTETSEGAGLPHNVAVRSKDLLLCEISDANRTEFQVIRTYSSGESKGSTQKQDKLDKEWKNWSGAGGPPTHEAKNIVDADPKSLFMVVGEVLLSEDVAAAADLANKRDGKNGKDDDEDDGKGKTKTKAKGKPKSKAKPKTDNRLKTLNGFSMEKHGESIAPPPKQPVKVVVPMYTKKPDTTKLKTTAKKNPSDKAVLHILRNMKDGLCDTYQLADGIENTGLFIFPEFTRTSGTEADTKKRYPLWSASMRDARIRWRSEHPELEPQDEDDATENLQHDQVSHSADELLFGKAQLYKTPMAREQHMVMQIRGAVKSTAIEPNDNAKLDRVKELLFAGLGDDVESHSPGLKYLPKVMQGSMDVDDDFARNAIKEFNVSCRRPVS